MRTIMGIEIGHREEDALKVQKLLTEHGCSIKTRLGLHEASSNQCSSSGLILLEFAGGKDTDIQALEGALAELPTVKVRKMEF